MELRYLLQLCRANLRFITILTAVATLGGLLATYVLPEKYESSTRILIRPSERVNFGNNSKTGMMEYPVSITIPVDSISQTYAEIMVSQAVAARVVEGLHLDRWSPAPDPRWYMRALHEARDWAKRCVLDTWDLLRYGRVERKDPYWKAVEEVEDGLHAKPIEDTYLFTLTAAFKDPEISAGIANAAASAFVDLCRETHRSEEGTSAGFVGENLETARKELDAARARLDEFRARVKTSSLEDELSLKLDATSKFQSELEDARKQLHEADAAIAVLDAQLAEQSREIHSSTTEAKNPVLQELETDLAKYEVELAGLRETRTDAHPQVQALLAKIGETRARIRIEASQVRASDTLVLNPIYQDLQQKHLQRLADRSSLEARCRALESTIERYQTSIRVLTAHKSELARLTLDVNVLEEKYRLLSREHEETVLAAAQTISEIRVLHPAVPPVYPAGPIKVYYAAGGLATGLLLALGLVLFADCVDHRIQSREDLESALRLSVLATVPHAKLPGRSARLLGDLGSSPEGMTRWRMIDGTRRKGQGDGDEPT